LLPYIDEQLFFEALMEPSLHRNSSPSQRAIPPFFPEQGVLAAHDDEQTTHSNNRHIGIQSGFKVRTLQLPVEIMAQ
jgi:hypothetical protein